MPYIKQENRKIFEPSISKLSIDIETEGDLNYIITKLLHLEILKQGLGYKTINSLVGVLECAKLELYRMIAAPYEDVKRKDNGDVSL
jgi:hypothetical protein